MRVVAGFASLRVFTVLYSAGIVIFLVVGGVFTTRFFTVLNTAGILVSWVVTIPAGAVLAILFFFLFKAVLP